MARSSLMQLLERLWRVSDLSEAEAMKLAVEAQHKTRLPPSARRFDPAS